MARPVLSDDQVEETRGRLCLAALNLYRAEGYEAVTLRELGAVAGVSHAMLYRYFRSKEDLFVYVRAAVFLQLGAHLQSRDPRDADPLTRLRSIALGLADYGRVSPEDYRLIFSMRQAVTSADSPVAKARTQVLAQVVEVCQLAIDAGQISGDAVTQAHLIWTSVHGLLSLHVSNLLVNGRSLDDLLPPILDHLLIKLTPEPDDRASMARPTPSRKTVRIAR